MPVIKQKTVNGTTLQLQRRKIDREGKEYSYFVTEKGGSMIDDPVYSRRRGEMQFEETVDAYRSADEANDAGGGGFGLFGGSSSDGGATLPGMGGGGGDPTLPGMTDMDQNDDTGDDDGPVLPGMGRSDESEDDDDGPRLPFF